jgi:hypothetical protein
MHMTQEQFNEIIDLFFLTVNAAADHIKKEAASENTDEDEDKYPPLPFTTKPDINASEKKAHNFLIRYIKTLNQLYRNNYPTVYLEILEQPTKTESTLLTRIETITQQLNKDFTPKKRIYTGHLYTKKITQSDTATVYDDASNPSFMMHVFSHPTTPLVGAALFLAGIATCTTGVLAAGVCLASIGGMMMAGYACHHFVFFTEDTSSTPSPTLTQKAGYGPQQVQY